MKVLALINNIYFTKWTIYTAPNEYIIVVKKNVTEENMSQEFRLKNIDEKINFFIEERKQNELTSKKHKNVSTAVNYIEHLLILASAVTGCISISAFVSLVGIPMSIAGSAVGLITLHNNSRN